jgi:hypothetical protein
LEAGLAVPIANLPEESILIDSTPPSANAIVSGDGKNIPVLESPVGLMDGAAVVPAATTTPPEAVTMPLIFRLLAEALPNQHQKQSDFHQSQRYYQFVRLFEYPSYPITF